MITINGNTIHLSGKNTSYIMFRHDDGYLLHFYFGKKIADADYAQMKSQWDFGGGFSSNFFGLDAQPQEYAAYGRTDLRIPSYQVKNQFGNLLSELKVKDMIIHNNETAETVGMPCLFRGTAHADTLEVVLYDEVTDFEVRLYYTVFDEYDIIARHAVLTNKSDRDVTLLSAYSATLDLPQDDFDMIHFSGLWARERDMIRTPLKQGIHAEAQAARGGSSNQMNPFVMIASRNADETHGDVYGFSLIYSGNHSTTASVDSNGQLRVNQGINPMQFEKTLQSGENFCAPQSVLCYSCEGFGAMSREYHDVYRNNLMRSKYTHCDRPILLNNWEGTSFDFTEEKLLAMAKKAKEAGMEMFVLDDGWFGERNNDHAGLGDWIVNLKKLPSGIKGLTEKINALGLDFGLWFEPEMVNPDSELFRNHPDWAVQVPERVPVRGRHQLILDLSRDDVCQYVIDAVCNILADANIKYVKWDMNRQMTDMPRPGYNHEYTLGYYKIMDAICSAFPDILFEGCSSGGARFDPGVLVYMPQIWASDNSDAIARLKIQYSTSMCYPTASFTSHVTECPNQQCGRNTPLKTRGDTAYIGTFGFELDITEMSDDELAEIAKQTEYAKHIRELNREGDFYRLVSPFETNYCSWETVSKDKNHVFLYACKILSVANTFDPLIKLQGLDKNKVYKEIFSGEVYSGDFLMNRGLNIDYKNMDFATEIMEFAAISED